MAMERRKGAPRMHREMPEDEHKILAELWYTLIGTNGEGAIERLRNLEEHVERLDKKLNDYFQEKREASCFYMIDKNKHAAVRIEKTRTLRETIKFVFSEGIKIGIAMGIFSAIGKLVGIL